MTQDMQQPLMETPPEIALAEDYKRLRLAFRASAAFESANRAVDSAASASELEQLRQEMSRLQRELDAVLASPTWRVGSSLTALPRRLRDRRSPS